MFIKALQNGENRKPDILRFCPPCTVAGVNSITTACTQSQVRYDGSAYEFRKVLAAVWRCDFRQKLRLNVL